MLILQMIIKITNWTQEKLASFLGVSRVTINYWLNGNDISTQSKKLISDKFNFPISYFDVSLNENIEYYKIIYSTLYKSINEILNVGDGNKSEEDKINDILNRIEVDDKTIYNKKISESDIIDGLSNGYNPFTGEIFDENHILNNEQVKNVIKKIKNKYYKFGINNVEYDDLNIEQQQLFQKLKKWRMDKTIEEGFYSAYMVFNDKELLNIICSKINKQEDLLNIKGIGNIKYEKYGEEIYKILKEFNGGN